MRKTLKTVQLLITIKQQGQSVKHHVIIPKNVSKIHCIFANTSFPSLSENILLQEDFNAILTEDGNNILIE